MAEKLDSFEFNPRGGGFYPWHDWFDGSVWRITPGEDFHLSHHSMRTMLYARAKDYNKKVRVHLEHDGAIVFQAYEEVEDVGR